MKLIEVYNKVLSCNTPIFSTNDLAVRLAVTNKRASQLLVSLSNEGMITHLRRSLWGISRELEPFMLPDYLTAPLPSYVSLQSALYSHGIISQIPSVVYAISLARSRQYITPIAEYSIHHIVPELFIDYDVVSQGRIKIAQPEKALFDFLYLKCNKTKQFYALPEVEIPSGFQWGKVKGYIRLIRNKSRASMVASFVDSLSKRC